MKQPPIDAPETRSLGERVRAKWRHGLTMQWMIDRLAERGIEVRMFYLFREQGMPEEMPDPPDIEGFTVSLLREDELDGLDRVDGRTIEAAELRQRLAKGDGCITVRDGERIAAFSWFGLRECRFLSFRFALKNNEAYLYDAHTLKPWRGRNLAILARRQTHRTLMRQGRNTFYSISEYFNRPALRFKDKLGARPVELCLCGVLWHRWRWKWILRRYEEPEAH